MIGYILWDKSAELLSWGSFTLRWDGLMLLLAFIVGKLMLAYIYKKENKPAKDVDLLITYLVIAVFICSRLGHVIFYQPELWNKPLTIFLPIDFKPTFHITGMIGFSSFGGVIGILIAIWFYSRKKKEGQLFLQLLDRFSILSVWIATLILVGSFLNSEIEGKPTNSSIGTLFINPVTKGLLKLPCCIMRNPGGKNPLDKVVATKEDKEPAKAENGHHSIALYLFFKSGTIGKVIDEFMVGDVKTYLYDMSQVVYESGEEPLHYAIFNEPNGDFEVRVRTIGIARHPVQLFEAITSLLLFVLLFWYWNKHKLNLSAGRIAGLCMLMFWGFRFMYEFIKEDQSSFIVGMGINKGQTLCIPLILIGAVILFISKKKNI